MKEITKTKKTKQSGEFHQSAKSAHRKEPNQAVKPSEEDANKKKTKNKKPPVCPLHGPGNEMNPCKVMLEQSKASESTWFTALDGGAGRVSFQGVKNRLN